MAGPWALLELVVAALLIVLNGAFALSELAIVSARRPRLKAMAEQGRPGARAALALAEDPGRFLSTTQIGITLVGVLSGAFSGAALGEHLSEILEGYGLARGTANALGLGVVITIITYLSVIIGELVPKHLALKDAEGIACRVAPAMRLVSRVGAPAVLLLDASTRAVFRVFGGSTETANAVTEEEIKSIVAEAETAGVIETDERKMIAGVLRLGDRAVRGVMTPRTDVEWLDLSRSPEEIHDALLRARHSRMPVAEGNPDDTLGVIQVRELLPPLLRGEPLDIRAHIRTAPVVPDVLDALDALNTLREAEVPMALVHDEYGHFDGLVTPADILDAIAGAFKSEGETEPEAVERADGSWLIVGWMPVDEMADQLGIVLPANRNYDTVAGLIISELQHLPATGEIAEISGWRFEVVDLDGRRVDKVLVSRIAPAEGEVDRAAP